MLTWIKKLLKKIMPPPVNTFNREIGLILQAIAGNSRRLENQLAVMTEGKQRLMELLDASNIEKRKFMEAVEFYKTETKRLLDFIKVSESGKQALASSLNTLTNECLKLQKSVEQVGENTRTQIDIQTKLLNTIRKEIPNKTTFWNNNFERDVVQSSFGNVSKVDNFEEMFLRLIKGLEPDSVNNIVKIIKRQQYYLQTKDQSLDLFTREEQEKLRRLQDEFLANIFKISDTLYCYKNYLLPVNHFEPSVFYYRHGLDQLETLDRVKSKDIIDVGGFIGDSALILSPLTNKKVYSFEAVSENYLLLQKTLELNQITNVVAENLALSSQNCFISISLAGSSSSTVKRKGINYRESIEVQAITLDEYVDCKHLDIGLIKVDIEGAEQDFLKGAVKSITTQKPILLISIYHNANDFFNIKPMIEDWDLGYKFRIHKPTISSITGEALLLAEVR